MTVLTMEVEQHVAKITLDNPPANALSSTVLRELAVLFDKIENDSNVRAVVIHSVGRFFSAGADIKEFTQFENDDSYGTLSMEGHQLFRKIETFRKPVIAAIHGAALGGGLELALSCHIRIATPTAKLGLPELQLGIIPGYGGTQRLPQLVGKANAVEMILSSTPISGEKAHTIGLVTKLAEEEQLVEEAVQLAELFASKSANAVQVALELINDGLTKPIDEGIQNEAKAFGRIFSTPDAKEGIDAFISKRPPKFNES